MTPKTPQTPRTKPVPVKLDAEALKRADAEAAKWQAAVERGTATLERISAEDFQIRLR